MRHCTILERVRRRSTDDSGASLMLVIIFVMVFSLVGAVILDFATTGFKTTESIVDIRDEQHAVDAAVEGAISAIRGSNTAGYAGETCPTYTYVTPAGTTDPEVVVTCTAQGGTIGAPTDDQPKYAVLTLGDDADEGFHQSGNETLLVEGGIFSNSKITVGTSAKDFMSVFGNALAVGPCTPADGSGNPTRISANGELQCSLEDIPTHSLTGGEPDPNYPAAVSALTGMAVDPAATCTSANSVVKFVPGVYTEHPENHIPAGCNGDVWWFSQATSPAGLGVYYFDFPEADSLWDLQDLRVNVVGGTPNGWSASSSAATVTAAFPNACLDTAPGVQFIFGGNTRLFSQEVSNSGRIHLCSSASTTTNQRIALYGLKSGATPSTSTSELKNKTTPSGDFSTSTQAWQEGGGAATTTLTGGVKESASEAYNDFEDIDLGSVVSKVYLDVYHSEASNKIDPSIDVTFGSGGRTYDLTNRSSHATAETLDITEDLQSVFRYQDVNSLAATFKVDAPSLDIAELCPGKKKGCTPSVAETATASLDAVILETGNNPQAIFSGTVYAPTGRLDIQVHNSGDVEFQRGVIARTIDADASASMKQSDSPFSLPGLVNIRRVLFEATVGGDPRLRALVQFTDKKNGVAHPGYVADVLNWVVLHA
jgi:hypothetical protein